MDFFEGSNQPEPWPEGYPKTQKCKNCDRILTVTPRPDQPMHKAEVYCPEHGRMWAGKPDNGKKPKRLVIRVECFPEHMRDFCWMCLRSKQLLSTLIIGLEVHHIIPVKDNGSGETENLMLVCSECHGVIHYRRRAFDRYRHRDRADMVLGEHIPMAEPPTLTPDTPTTATPRQRTPV